MVSLYRFFEELVFCLLVQILVLELADHSSPLSEFTPSFEVMGIVIIDPIGGTHRSTIPISIREDSHHTPRISAVQITHPLPRWGSPFPFIRFTLLHQPLRGPVGPPEAFKGVLVC